MSYCRFENTYADLKDCYEALSEKPIDDLSESERKYAKLLIKIACNIAGFLPFINSLTWLLLYPILSPKSVWDETFFKYLKSSKTFISLSFGVFILIIDKYIYEFSKICLENNEHCFYLYIQKSN